jgi:chloramphenicol 3-O phosphotransferase
MRAKGSNGAYHVILLNGCTSAGKTSLARALQASLPELWLHLSLDHFLSMTPRKFHGVAEGMRLVSQADGTKFLTHAVL